MEKTATILLVEDQPEDRFFMEHALREAGVPNPVFMAPDGEEALKYLGGSGQFADRDRHPLPCLIVTDLKMPRVDGFELLEWLRHRPEFDGVPKIVLSGSAEPQDQKRATALGASAYLVKPSGIAELVNVVKYLDAAWIAAHCARPAQAGAHV